MQACAHSCVCVCGGGGGNVTGHNSTKDADQQISSNTPDILFQDHLRKDLKAKRLKLMLQMQTQGKSTQEMEQKILTAGCKLRTVVEENHKFDEVI